jgi:hypothetical protein
MSIHSFKTSGSLVAALAGLMGSVSEMLIAGHNTLPNIRER